MIMIVVLIWFMLTSIVADEINWYDWEYWLMKNEE
jgi:hypothetical protein